MALLHCPECGHEVAATAVACPNCGRPTATPVVETRIPVVPVERREAFPTWAFIPIGLLAVILLAVIYLMVRESDEGNTNINVNLAGRRPTTDPARTTTVPSSDSGSVTVPGQTTTTTTTAPGQTTTVPGTSTSVTAPAPDKGAVVIKAELTQPRGAAQPVRNAKFYLLEQSVESILSDAGVEPIEGNTLSGSLGLSIVYPDRYGDFNRTAMRAISSKAKYSGTSDGSGKASVTGVTPGSYYLFGLARAGRGFALWNSPVSVIAGDNILNSPQSVTEVRE